MKPVAFFDIDGTIFRSSLLVELVEALVEEGSFPAEAIFEYADSHERWRNREGTYDEYIADVVDSFVRHIKGVHYGTFADLARKVVRLQSKHVYRYTRDLIQQLRAEGYTTIAISQSPKTILDEFCRQYGFDKVYGRIYEIGPNDCFTGAVTAEDLIQDKSKIVERVYDRSPELSPAASIAVGDTEGDISLLESVARPICFNPNFVLYAHAKEKGWEVVVERKDVIYKL